MSKQTDSDRFRTRLALVTAAALISWGLTGVHLSFPTRTVTKTVKEPVVVHDNTTAPDGKITRAECAAKLKGMTLKDVVNRYGLPENMDPTERFFDSLSYPLRNSDDPDKDCNVYFEAQDGVDLLDVNPSNFIVRNVSVDL